MSAKSGNKIFVSVCCITYNHEKYISKAIESILMQKTKFSYQLVIGEDNSADNTKQICEQYVKSNPNRVRLLHSEKNIGMVQNFTRTINACTGKYIAICEGDDYWADPYKLQKQVDILENNLDYGLVHTDYDILYDDSQVLKKKYYQHNNVTIAKENAYSGLLVSWGIKTATVCFRKDIVEQSIKKLNRSNIMIFDLPLFLMMSTLTKFAYINESMVVYRHLNNSASHHLDKDKYYAHLLRNYKIKQFFIDNYDVSEKTREIVKKQYYIGMFIRAIKNNDAKMINSSFNDICKNNLYSHKYRIIYILTKFIFTRFLLRRYLCQN